jgi:NADH:ubiquinone oxidoreductase subunit K
MLDLVNFIDYNINSNLVSLQQFLEVVIIIAMIGMLGILSNRKNLLMSVISIEMMFYGLNVIFVIGSLYLDDMTGEAAAIFILTLAGAESALALALITAYFKTHYTINLTEVLGE